ncbi:hypothetical protein TRFO_33151 [Tritrichomonas foetus]|uniref:Uncharacterized protein n=1 Tax=Tritrichomonas foetus TaxID=1144522 RepID=A0A1J4JSI7_9EUKA|nr:hypothetical protein TRFO_33151 [Tritrichomonas foetus]|eukprot:OHT00205.1 hypothetical protein TRFO_33151 [Tritrichomonas foetus]
MIDKKVSQLNKFIKEKVELVNENSKQFHSELHDMGLSVKQFSHNIETSMNALETQKKSTEKYLYEEMKRLDAKLVKDKMEYSQNIERKILELQETTNKTVKALTEIHINKQNTLQKEFILSLPKNTINVKKMRSIKEKLKKFKLNISNMQNSINSLIHAEHNHSTSMKDSVNKLCELIKDELEAVNSKNPKTCNIYKNLDENLKKIIMEIKSRNNQVIIEKMEEIKKLEETRNDLVKKYEIILREKEKHNKEKSKIEKEEINSLLKSFIVEISECKLRILEEKEKIEQNIKELEEKIKISQTCEMQNTKFTNDEYNQEIEDLKDKFLIDIESASNSFRVRQNALRDTYSNENIYIEIALAVSSLATLQKELTSIAAPPIFESNFDESVNSINRLNDDSICNDDVNKLKDLQKQEYEDKVTSCNDKLEKLSQKYSNEEVKYSEQLEANYQVSMRNAKMMLTSQNEIKNKENEYMKTFKLENETLNSIPMVYKNNFNSNQFEKVDKMIENLNHKYFQLKSSIKIQKASLISDFELEDKEEIQRFEKKLAQLSPEQQEWVNLSQHLIEIQQLRTNEENELKNQLLILRKREQQILDDFEQKVNNINQNDNYLTLLNLLSDLQNDSNLQLHHKENEVNQEIEILEDQIKEYNEYFETEKNLINDGLTRITNELNEYQINKNERLQNIQEDFEKQINKEKEKYSQTLR